MLSLQDLKILKSKEGRHMKKILVAILVVLIAGCATLGLQKSGALKPYKTSKLENGLNILYVNDEKLPYLSLSLVTMAGYARDPRDQTGLTAATFELLSKGIPNKNAIQLAHEIEQMGAELDATVTADYSMVSMEGLAWQEEKMLSLFADIVLRPTFLEAEIKRYQSRAVAVVQQRLDQAANLANEAFDGFYYGQHPYSQRDVGLIAHIKKLNRKAIVDHYNKVVRPNNSWLVVVGKYPSDIESKLQKHFGSWKPQDVHFDSLPQVEPIKGRKILLVNKADAAQAEIRIGHRGTDRRAEDHVHTTIANSILGQGFTSKLVDRIRDQLGLTYSISSRMDFKLHGSSFEIKTFTQNPRVGQTLSEIYKVYEEFQKEGVSKSDLETAQKYMVGVFPSLVETAEKTAYNLMVLRLFGVSDDYLRDYQKNIAKSTLSEVNASIKKNFDPHNIKIVIVAKKDEVLPQLKDLGDVEVIEAKTFFK